MLAVECDLVENRAGHVCRSADSGGWHLLRGILCRLLQSSPDARSTVSQATTELQNLLEETRAQHVL